MAAVIAAIPTTETRVIKLITFFFRLAERYRFAIKKGTLMASYFFRSSSIF
tara:strand:- start:406 stop:558 length:153 start_codon:yes stop_codon:yes gene_type:complete